MFSDISKFSYPGSGLSTANAGREWPAAVGFGDWLSVSIDVIPKLHFRIQEPFDINNVSRDSNQHRRTSGPVSPKVE
jgi:hypothetical protein